MHLQTLANNKLTSLYGGSDLEISLGPT